MVNHFSSVVLYWIQQNELETCTHVHNSYEKTAHTKTNNWNNSLHSILIWVLCTVAVHVLRFSNLKFPFPLSLVPSFFISFGFAIPANFIFANCAFVSSFLLAVSLSMRQGTFAHSMIHKWTFGNFSTLSCDLSQTFHKINDILWENEWSSSFNICMYYGVWNDNVYT